VGDPAQVDDAEDLVFGDITAERIPPDSFIYDPWALTSAEGLQNGQFMGKWSWQSKDDFLDEFPNHAGYATTGEWMNIPNKFGQSSGDLLGTSDQLLAEMWDPINGRVRVVTLWCKKPIPVTLVVDHNSGRVYNMPDKDKARHSWRQWRRKRAAMRSRNSSRSRATGLRPSC
jgi:hypothetical protein